MKASKFLLAASFLLLAAVLGLAPALNVVAQTDQTPTPAVIFVTATPSDNSGNTGSGSTGTTGSAPSTEAAAPSGVTTAATPDASVPREKQALRAALAVLGKAVGQRITYVKQWSWELDAFSDTALGCPGANDHPQKTFSPGYKIVVTLFNNAQYELHVTWDLSKVYTCSAVGGSTGGTPLSAPPAAAGASRVTNGAFEAGAQIYDFGNSTVARLHTAHLKWIKVQVSPSDGSASARIGAAHGQGFKILLSIKGGAGEVLNAGFFDQFASYAGSVAAAGADAIEVWNEENIDREWPTGHIDPGLYTQLLQKSFAAIKGANSGTMVISGALSPTGYWQGSNGKSNNGWDDDVYYQGMAAAGAGQYADCIGVHYNEGIVGPDQTSGDPRDQYPTRFFDTMLQRAVGPFGGTKACFTELGYLTPQGYPPLPNGFQWAQNTTVAQQASWLAGAASRAAASGRVRLIIVFNADFVRYDADPQAGYAMIRPDGSCPACDALGAVLP